MTKLNPIFKIALIITTILLACAAIATPILIFTTANSDTNPNDYSLSSTNQNPQTTNSTNSTNQNPESNSPENSEHYTAEELQTQRDQQRRSDMALLQAAITQFQVNNNGKLPGQGSNLDGQGELVYQPSEDHSLPSASNNVAAKLITNYLNSASASENSFVDPDGWAYGLTITDYNHYGNLPEKNASHMIYLLHQACCDATKLSSSDKPRDFTILYKLENGNIYCLDNQ